MMKAIHWVVVTVVLLQLAGNLLGAGRSEQTAAPAPSYWATRQCLLRPQDEIWFIGTRHLGDPARQNEPDPKLEVLAYRPGRHWLRSSIPAFLAGDGEPGERITVFYVHGNREDRASSFASGWAAYRGLTRNSTDDRALRFVIWSWPSDRIRGPLRDIRVKAARTECDGYYLGWLLSRMDPAAPVSLIGYSYGARIVLGALHISCGGRLCGRRLRHAPGRPISRVRVVLLAAAEHNDWLMPGQHHDHAYLRIGRMLVLYNSCDAALSRYRWVDPCARPSAMGYTGVAGRWCLDDRGERIDQLDVCCMLGRTHLPNAYFGSTRIARQMQRLVFWEPLSSTLAKNGLMRQSRN